MFLYLQKIKEYCRGKIFTKIKVIQVQYKNIPLNFSEKKASTFTQKYHQIVTLSEDLTSVISLRNTGLIILRMYFSKKRSHKSIHLLSVVNSVF